MAVGISIKADVKHATRFLTRYQKKQIPFATSKALNKIVFKTRKELQKQAKKKLDQPTKFTINSFLFKNSHKRNLTARIFIRDVAYNYLKYAIEGGKRRPNKRFLPVPVREKLNKFGNIPGRKRGPRNKKQFVATIRGITGVWERVNKSGPLKLMVFYSTSADYTSRFNYFKIVQSIVKSQFKRVFITEFNKALHSAR